MEDNRVLRRPKYLTIGEFPIAFQRNGTDIRV